MVPRKRLELLHRKATASKTVVSTNSTTWASMIELRNMYFLKWWAGRDSNPRSRRQRIYSPPHLTTLVPTQIKYESINTRTGISETLLIIRNWTIRNWKTEVEPPIRLELMTAGLQNRCSTNWAKVACAVLYKKWLSCQNFFVQSLLWYI